MEEYGDDGDGDAEEAEKESFLFVVACDKGVVHGDDINDEESRALATAAAATATPLPPRPPPPPVEYKSGEDGIFDVAVVGDVTFAFGTFRRGEYNGGAGNIDILLILFVSCLSVCLACKFDESHAGLMLCLWLSLLRCVYIS